MKGLSDVLSAAAAAGAASVSRADLFGELELELELELWRRRARLSMKKSTKMPPLSASRPLASSERATSSRPAEQPGGRRAANVTDKS